MEKILALITGLFSSFSADGTTPPAETPGGDVTTGAE